MAGADVSATSIHTDPRGRSLQASLDGLAPNDDDRRQAALIDKAGNADYRPFLDLAARTRLSGEFTRKEDGHAS